ncbi:SubName: Full=Uncharacterized protein {ECO:0000313/EMBL:CCA69987.1} [Serendipita indica DSM 11827]|nr:SubName: Full=Uncharacterized protein {ECO:0000313/EMBL:CCA69987.1} [Serendipita indica DSM 11827]
MRAKDVFALVPVPSHLVKHAYSRITLTRFTTAYFVVAFVHALLLSGFQLGSHLSNKNADTTLSQIMKVAEVKSDLIPVITNQNGQDVLRLCNGIPSSANDDRCQTIFVPTTDASRSTNNNPNVSDNRGSSAASATQSRASQLNAGVLQEAQATRTLQEDISALRTGAISASVISTSSIDTTTSLEPTSSTSTSTLASVQIEVAAAVTTTRSVDASKAANETESASPITQPLPTIILDPTSQTESSTRNSAIEVSSSTTEGSSSVSDPVRQTSESPSSTETVIRTPDLPQLTISSATETSSTISSATSTSDVTTPTSTIESETFSTSTRLVLPTLETTSVESTSRLSLSTTSEDAQVNETTLSESTSRTRPSLPTAVISTRSSTKSAEETSTASTETAAEDISTSLPTSSERPSSSISSKISSSASSESTESTKSTEVTESSTSSNTKESSTSSKATESSTLSEQSTNSTSSSTSSSTSAKATSTPSGVGLRVLKRVDVSPVANSTTGVIAGLNVTMEGQGSTTYIDLRCAQSLSIVEEHLHQSRAEDLVMLGYYIWLFGLGTVAILNESIPHLSAALLSSALALVWSGVQISRTKAFQQQFNTFIKDGACNGTDLISSYWSERAKIEVPSFVLNATCFLLLAGFGTKLLSVYRRQTKKTTGEDPLMKRLYRAVLLLSVIVQTSTFLLLASLALWVQQLFESPIASFSAGTPVFKGVGLASVLMVVPWFIIGWIAIRREHKMLMIAFLIMNVFFLGSWTVVFSSDIYRLVFTKWSFFAVITVTSFGLLVGSLIAGLLCRLRFGQGLAVQLAEKDQDEVDTTPWEFSNTVEKAWEPFADVRQSQFTSSDRQSTAFSYGLRSPAPPVPAMPAQVSRFSRFST